VIVVLSAGTVRARKSYRCHLHCDEAIEVGEVHHRQGGVCDGDCYTFRAHLHCHALSAADFADRLWDDEGLAEIEDIDLSEWSRARVEAACDQQGWSPSHPSRERARALWQRIRGDEPPARMERTWWGDVPGTALERRLT